MDQLDAMRLFIRVVESGSFSAAAREAGLGQPNVSKQIAALEVHLGAQLLRRTSRLVTVTEAGQTFYEASTRLVEDLEAAESLIGRGQSEPAGLVRVSVAPVFGRLYLVPLLAQFFARFPGISVELSTSERSVDLIEEGIDLAIRHGALGDSSMIAKTIGLSSFVTVATPAYIDAHGEPASPGELEAYSCVVFAPLRETYPWKFATKSGQIAHHPKGNFRTADAEQVRAAVLAGLGLAHAPAWLFMPEIASGQVRVVLQSFQPPPTTISFVHPSGRRLPTKVRVLMEFLEKHLPLEKRSEAGEHSVTPSPKA